ncbi:glycosyltransferase family 2 protein [Mesorhizobium sp. M1066]|uniref:glycosyltransferase family 2 protein n=3 Tax=Phyllobacteriaceae TaxID=69277 RepID=UPI000FCA32C8|nr:MULTISPECIES: glycosyltransferase family 2 protein [Mesorhizobium]RWN93889.1 MAG: glycosyltransferase family 2 protein [Mesorhizobium sp.]MCF6122796.1 glycosyltransferase family 2 protein [Mesorhizobium ciceri]MCQ8813260.1 glycosyltransferase family 2 protein [Mesorhizobium sp. SEMIA396]RUU78576.1 glycosyltransferase family 2 protein [Mesorhizobium sp. M7A.F.Ca.MR.362.00.0.0]RUX75050.1 glycosyltransferase family 2 protein [Mesorhizobium sp. M7A.F.Ca.CA.004.08.2.1]
MFDWSQEIVLGASILSWFIIGAGLAQTAIYLLQLIIAAYALSKRPPVARSALLWHRYGDVAPPIALLVPAYNEEVNVVESVHSMLALEYPNFEVIVINDGSKDQTLQRLIEGFKLVKFHRPYEEALTHKPIRGLYSSPMTERLFVVDKENGGKADAQNAGVNVCRAPLFCVIDGDSILEPDALMRAAQPFIDDPERTIAVGGTIRIANGSRIEAGRVREIRLPSRLLALFQVVEYLRAFLMARLAWSRINTLMLVSGAFGVFRRAEVVAVGGFTKGSMGEDMDLVIKLHRHMMDTKRKYRIQFIPEPVCWTEAPESLRVLARQRTRWQRGALECFFRYRSMLFNPRYGRVGFLGFGHILIVDVLGPISEVLGYVLIPAFWLLGILSTEYLLAFTSLVFTYGVCVSVCSLVLEEAELQRFPRARDLAVLTAVAVIENFGYRQLNNFWRVKGWWQYLRADQSWGEMTRTGLTGPKK